MSGKRKDCVSCDKNCENLIKNVKDYNYIEFTGTGRCLVPSFEDNLNISYPNFIKLYDQENFNTKNIVIDTRSKASYNVLHLKNSTLVPVEEILYCKTKVINSFINLF